MPCCGQHRREPLMDRWSRRQFVQGLGVAGLTLLAGCGRLPGQAQPDPASRAPRLGYLSNPPYARPAETAPSPVDGFRQGLRELGYVEGQNIHVEYRTADGRADRLPGLATELLGLGVDVFVTAGTLATRAARQAADT